MPEGAHPLPEFDDTETCDVCGREVIPGIMPTKGWSGLPMLDLDDGKAWPLSFAAKYLEVSEEYLRVTIKELGIEPSGVIPASAFRRSGRQPRAYNARTLVIITDALENIRQELGLQDPTS